MDSSTSHEKPSRFGGLIGVGAAVLITVGLTSLLHARFAMGERPEPRTPLTVDWVLYEEQSSYQREVSYLGLVSAGRKANLGFEVAGTVATLPWREGSPVATGEIIAWLNLAIVDRKSMSKQQQSAIINIIDDRVVQGFLHHVWRQKHDDGSALGRFIWCLHRKPICLGFSPAGAGLAQPDNDIKAGILEIECMRTPLAAIAKNADLLITKD